MRKSIPKPSNWQDFEALCCMLWGEIWSISDKIKLNGRLGQPQSGVDIYGIPKDKFGYSGIQCKGKNEDLYKILTKNEIDKEIENAKKFKPKLETFILATTSNKDVLIEEYVRERDMESRSSGGFEILLFCWEDIASKIETHRNTFNYYVTNQQFKTNYDIDITFNNGLQEFIVSPLFKKVTIVKTPSVSALSKASEHYSRLRHLGENKSWVLFQITFKNIGSLVIEDYKLHILPAKDGFRKLTRNAGIVDVISSNNPFYIFDDGEMLYRPITNEPLIQKDRRTFKAYLLANHSEYNLQLKYHFMARDFDKEGYLALQIKPQYELATKYVSSSNLIDTLEGEVIEDVFE